MENYSTIFSITNSKQKIFILSFIYHGITFNLLSSFRIRIEKFVILRTFSNWISNSKNEI